MENIICMYVTLMPVILAGVLNMVWCKLPILKFFKKPIDGGICIGNKRLFGDNKTWKGLIGYVLLNSICMLAWGMVCYTVPALAKYNFLYLRNQNTWQFNLFAGVLLGLGYSLFELPNSFLKRRIDIEPGKTLNGFWSTFFVIVDQADSLFGCVLVVSLFYPMSIMFYFAYVALGAATHIILNVLLYLCHLRKNMF